MKRFSALIIIALILAALLMPAFAQAVDRRISANTVSACDMTEDEGNALNKELRKEQATTIVLEPLNHPFAVCKVTDYSGVNIHQPFCFTGATDEAAAFRMSVLSVIPEGTGFADE